MQATFDQKFQAGRNQSWNLSIEHEFNGNIMVQAAYIGAEAYHLPTPIEENPGFFSAGGARLWYPQLGSIKGYQATNTQSYNALQLVFEKRFSRGVQFSSNYCWSKNLDASSLASLSNTGSFGNPFDLSWGRGISDINSPQIWNNSWVWETPSLRNYGGLASSVLGDWEVSGIWSLHSGRAFSISGGQGNNRSLAQVGGDRGDLTGQPLNVRQGSKSQWLNQYFNPLAFTFNAPGTFGNSPRNFLTGPGYNNLDLLLAKNIPFKERYRVQFRWEMFNALNRTAFAPPVADPGSSNFARIVSTFGSPRLQQVGLKLFW